MPGLTPRRPVAAQQRLRDQVAQALRAAVLAGELPPGTLHSAPVLAARYGVSATPVREAMLDLAREGLVEPVRNKGFRITRVSARELDEYAEVRALIEVPTVGRITRTVDPEQLAPLRPPAKDAVAAATARDVPGYLEADARFHLALLTLAGNRRLVEVVGDLARRSGLSRPTASDLGGGLLRSAGEHLELLDLMAVGDAAAAEQCMARHLHRPTRTEDAGGRPRRQP
jgi:DNA-binding GntR family transcriptional regulator